MGYVGQTINTLYGRWKGHVHGAFNPKSRTGHWELPKAIREHGAGSFTGKILCECETPEELSLMETYWMHELNTMWPNGYNMRDGSNFVCEQTRKLISERTKASMAKLDPSWKERQRNAMNDPNVKRTISDRTKSAMQRPEIKEKIAAIKQDPEVNERISKKLMGHVVSEETRRKISENTRKAMQRPEVQEKLAKRTSDCVVVDKITS